MLIRRGDLLLIDFAPARDGEANYIHPAIVVTNNVMNIDAPVIVVIPLTNNIERTYHFQVFLPSARTGLNFDSKAQVELVRHIGTTRILKRLSFLPDDLMDELDQRLLEHLALKR